MKLLCKLKIHRFNYFKSDVKIKEPKVHIISNVTFRKCKICGIIEHNMMPPFNNATIWRKWKLKKDPRECQ